MLDLMEAMLAFIIRVGTVLAFNISYIFIEFVMPEVGFL